MRNIISYSVNPIKLYSSLRKNRALIFNLIKREAVGRYRGTILGLFWSFFNPVLMLAVYTFVFSVVFKARWIGGTESRTEFALVLFSGLMVFNLFSESINRSPSLIISNVNFVKKVIFPLEILPIVSIGSAAFHFFISLIVWLLFYLVFFGKPCSTILQLPLIIFPLALMTVGLSWLLASLGVYLRDLAQIIGVVTTVLMLLSPIFYPIGALPEAYRPFLHISPLTFPVDQARNIMIWGKGIDWSLWWTYSITSAFISWLGYVWFQKTRKGFADVL